MVVHLVARRRVMDEKEELLLAVALAVRDTCFHVAHTRYEDAGMSGLCHEGAVEVALDAIRSLDVAPILEEVCGSYNAP